MLGRGLQSLIPPKSEASTKSKEIEEINPARDEVKEIKEVSEEKKPQDKNKVIFQIEIEKIINNPYQPRKEFKEEPLRELAVSIQEFGILQPLLVSKIEEEIESGTRVFYQLIAGQRRLLAAKMLGWKYVPVIIKKTETKSSQIEIAIIENLQRADLNPIEKARAFAKLSDEFGLSQREIAQRIGKSREVIANTMRLLNLPTNIQEALSAGKINESQARILLAIEDVSKQQILFQEMLTGQPELKTIKTKLEQETNPEIIYLQNQLEEFLGVKTKINLLKNNRGKIVIKFFSQNELDDLIKKICSSGFL